jgi:hypothetical protein
VLADLLGVVGIIDLILAFFHHEHANPRAERRNLDIPRLSGFLDYL